jgi:hypothetical protein
MLSEAGSLTAVSAKWELSRGMMIPILVRNAVVADLTSN